MGNAEVSSGVWGGEGIERGGGGEGVRGCKSGERGERRDGGGWGVMPGLRAIVRADEFSDVHVVARFGRGAMGGGIGMRGGFVRGGVCVCE